LGARGGAVIHRRPPCRIKPPREKRTTKTFYWGKNRKKRHRGETCRGKPGNFLVQEGKSWTRQKKLKEKKAVGKEGLASQKREHQSVHGGGDQKGKLREGGSRVRGTKKTREGALKAEKDASEKGPGYQKKRAHGKGAHSERKPKKRAAEEFTHHDEAESVIERFRKTHS